MYGRHKRSMSLMYSKHSTERSEHAWKLLENNGRWFKLASVRIFTLQRGSSRNWGCWHEKRSFHFHNVIFNHLRGRGNQRDETPYTVKLGNVSMTWVVNGPYGVRGVWSPLNFISDQLLLSSPFPLERFQSSYPVHSSYYLPIQSNEGFGACT